MLALYVLFPNLTTKSGNILTYVRLLGVGQTTSNTAIYGELGRCLLYINTWKRPCDWFKVIPSENTIVKSVNTNSTINNVQGNSQAFKVKVILECSDVWLHPEHVCVYILNLLVLTKNGLLT